MCDFSCYRFSPLTNKSKVVYIYIKVIFELQIFYERMLSAKNYSIDEEKRWIASKGVSNSPDLYSR